ncbi:MAG: 50S ribosomal protein L29 [Nitrosarchaeum sp.]|nr:50S ribosomal protein L29 [Nitrosarchaeum sp.]
MKFSELKSLTPEALEKRCKDMELELMKLRVQVAQGTAQKASGKIRELRRSIARVKTLQNKHNE